ncbi:MAG: PIN domain-containing protein [Burkholderiaceae bacterium]
MTVLVDTSVWSLAFRRDGSTSQAEVRFLREALTGADSVVTTGLVLQELLQGFAGPRAAEAIIERFRALPLIQPDRIDHIAAAEVRNTCRRAGVQVGTIDALLIQLCGRHELTLLTTDKDFVHASQHLPVKIWRS